jgi:CHAT domain-containing protein/Tfp pilus assembly protein PilF
MGRCILGCYLFFYLTIFAVAQPVDLNLVRGRELLFAEEYRSARYYLRHAVIDAKKKSNREEAKILLAELFLLTHQPDSASLLVNQLPDKGTRAFEIRFLQALHYFQENNFTEAKKLLVLLQSSPVKDFILKGKINYYSGVINFRLRSAESLPQSIHDLETSIRSFERDSTSTYLKLALARLQLADVFRVTEEPQLAIDQLHLADKILKSSPYLPPLYNARLYGGLAKVYHSTKNYYEGKAAYEKSLQMQRNANADSAAIGITLSNMGLFYDELGNQWESEKTYEYAVAWLPAPKKEIDYYVNFLNNYGMFLRDIQEVNSGLQSLLRARQWVEGGRLNSKLFVYQTYFNLAITYYDLDDFSSCKEYLDRLDNFVKENPTVLPRRRTLKVDELKAMWFRKENQFDKAIDLCRSINTQLDSADVGDRQRADFYATYGDILISADQLPLSIEFLRKARLIYVAGQLNSQQVEISNLLAMSFFNQNLYDSALLYSNQGLRINALETKEGLIYPYLEPQAAIQSSYLSMASFIKQFQKTHQADFLDKAIPYEQLGINLIRSIRKNLYSDADRVAYNKAVTKFYDACCLLHFYCWQNLRAGAIDKFFEFVEESKFQALSNSLNINRVNSFKEVNSALVKEEKEIAKQKILDNKQLIQLVISENESENTGKLERRKADARGQLQSLERKHERFLDSLRRNFSGYYLLKYGGESFTLSELKEELRPQQLILQLKVIDSVLVVQAIAKGFESLFLVPHLEALRKQATKMRNLIQFKLQSDFVPLSNEVFLSLLKPVETELKKNRIKIDQIIVVPDDFFYLLPFEALVAQTKPLRYLIESYEISYAYSCNLMVQNKRDLLLGLNKTFLGIAPRFSGTPPVPGLARSSSASSFYTPMSYDEFGFQPLKENVNEINLIGSSLSSAVPHTLLSGNEADEAHIKKLDLSKFNYIHFATHGFVNANNSGLSGMALTNSGEASEDNILYTAEIYNLNLKAKLVCLSACETGLGQTTPGEGLIGLGRAFFYSGAQNLLVSLWKVPDESTSQFMIDFYKYLFGQSNEIQSSLRQAKLKMLKTQKYHSPYYWAPFILIGSN